MDIPLQKALSLIALVVAPAPIVGLVVAAMALLANRKMPSWPRTVSFVALGISLLVSGTCGCFLGLGASGVLK